VFAGMLRDEGRIALLDVWVGDTECGESVEGEAWRWAEICSAWWRPA
jgi:hypothetical protein